MSTQKAETTVKTTGRPRKKLDIDMLEKLAMHPLTLEVCCELIGTNVNAFYKRKDAQAAWRRGRARGKQLIGQNLLKLSRNNASVAIFLGKSVLGLRDDGVVADDIAASKLIIDETDPIDGGV